MAAQSEIIPEVVKAVRDAIERAQATEYYYAHFYVGWAPGRDIKGERAENLRYLAALQEWMDQHVAGTLV
jgi:hypothetical protein